MAVAEASAAHTDVPSGVAASQGRLSTVVADDVHVTYRVYEDRRSSLRQIVANRFRQREYREVAAVRGVSFQSFHGEAIGIIGRNGSGKSTLLRTLAGLMPATRGAVYASSSPVLLGVGAALHPELSGRRNVILGALALGMSKTEIAQRFDEIVDFAGVTDHIDMPLRTYSSGMAARLHFAIASAMTPQILLIDEALAVGDEDFKDKSARRLEELRSRAGTVFIVSHSLGALADSCSRMLWIDQGRVRADGVPAQVIDDYRRSLRDGPKRAPPL